jgi:hypothetical protein
VARGPVDHRSRLALSNLALVAAERLTGSGVDNSSTDGEQQDLDRHRDVERGRELFGVLHVSDKGRNQGLSGKGVDDVEQGADALNKGRSLGGPDGPFGGRLHLVDEAVRVILDSVAWRSGGSLVSTTFCGPRRFLSDAYR